MPGMSSYCKEKKPRREKEIMISEEREYGHSSVGF